MESFSQSSSMKKLNTFCKSTTTLDFQTEILVPSSMQPHTVIRTRNFSQNSGDATCCDYSLSKTEWLLWKLLPNRKQIGTIQFTTWFYESLHFMLKKNRLLLKKQDRATLRWLLCYQRRSDLLSNCVMWSPSIIRISQRHSE